MGKFDPKNWSFSKLTEIWYKHTLLYPCFEFNAIFLIFFVHSFFWAHFVPKSEFLQINWSLVPGYIAKCLSYFCKIFVIHSFLDIFGSNLVPNSLIVNIFFCVTILIRGSSRNSLHNTVVESVRFAPLWNSKIYPIIETNKYHLHNYKLIKN